MAPTSLVTASGPFGAAGCLVALLVAGAVATPPAVATGVRATELEIAITSDSAVANPIDGMPYTVTMTNHRSTAVSGATFSVDLTGVLDDATGPDSPWASSGTVRYTAPTLTWTGDLPAGAAVTVAYGLPMRNPEPGDHRLVTGAVSTTPGTNCPPPPPARNRRAVEDPRCRSTVPVADAVLRISADRRDVAPGETVNVAITMTNIGRYDLADTGFYEVRGQTNRDERATSGRLVHDYEGNVLRWFGSLRIGESVRVTYSVTPRNPPPGPGGFVGGDVYSNSTSDCVPIPEFPGPGVRFPSEGCSVFVPVTTMRIAASTDVAFAAPGGTVRHTVRVRNTSGARRTDLSFSADLRGVVDDATYNRDAGATSGTVAVRGSTLRWTGTLGGSGAVATVTFSVRVRQEPGGDGSLDSAITSPARGTNCPTHRPNVPPAERGCFTHVEVVRPATGGPLTSAGGRSARVR